MIRWCKYIGAPIVVLQQIIGCSAALKLDQVGKGNALYRQQCASCHDMETGIGPELSKDVIVTHRSANLLYSYIRDTMPYEAGKSLKVQEYWDITAYILSRHRLLPSEIDLGPKTAEGLTFKK